MKKIDRSCYIQGRQKTLTKSSLNVRIHSKGFMPLLQTYCIKKESANTNVVNEQITFRYRPTIETCEKLRHLSYVGWNPKGSRSSTLAANRVPLSIEPAK